jgi:4-amino-4-deoxy-L-arabinose transferase-like glycosyltransferase
MNDRFVSAELASATAVVEDGRFDVGATITPPEVAPNPPLQDEPDELVPTDLPGVGSANVTAADEGPTGTPDRTSPPAGLWRRFLRGRDDDPTWVRPTLAALLVATAVLYIWGLGASGWANSFYSAAVQAGTKSWKAFFFGSFDASSFITVDKPPAFLWVMGLSARIFGLSSWSVLLPQALEGVATVWLVYACVRRWFTATAGLLAGAVVALTPVATLMFRYNNPDALLTLLLTASAYATIRALERGRSLWLVLAGTFLGLGFITKMLEALIITPVLALVYLLCGPPRLGRRLLQVVYLGLATLVAGGWWVAVVQLTPTAIRPYVGGSTDNSELNLIFGYNGFGRITGNETGSVGGTGIAGSMWGPTGWDRLFMTQMGGQVSWLIPSALIGLVATLWLTRRAPRVNRTRAAFLLFGGWLLLMGAVFSFSHGIIHPYYTVALAPAVGALVGMGASTLWTRRGSIFPRMALAAAVVASIAWEFIVLGWSPQWYPPLRWAIVIGGGLAALGIALLPRARGLLLAGLCGLGLVAILAGPAFYSLNTASTPHNGAIPTAGPPVQNGTGGFLGFGGFGNPGGTGGRSARGFGGGFGGPGGGGGFGGGGLGQILQNINQRGVTLPPGFTLPNGTTLHNGLHLAPGVLGRLAHAFGGGSVFRGELGFGGQRGFSGGGLLNASTPGRQLVTMLEQDSGHYSWVAATTGANSAAGYQLATDDPVMAIGGFNGTDPAPTLAAFEKDVAGGLIHYYIAGGLGGFGGLGGSQSSTVGASAISAWVTSHFTAQTVDGVTVYNVTKAAAALSSNSG